MYYFFNLIKIATASKIITKPTARSKIFIIFTKSAKLKHNAISSMALLSSGIFMNTLERIQNGYVTDYISCNLLPYLPVFNTADILIVCGALGIIISLFARN